MQISSTQRRIYLQCFCAELRKKGGIYKRGVGSSRQHLDRAVEKNARKTKTTPGAPCWKRIGGGCCVSIIRSLFRCPSTSYQDSMNGFEKWAEGAAIKGRRVKEGAPGGAEGRRLTFHTKINVFSVSDQTTLPPGEQAISAGAEKAQGARKRSRALARESSQE